MKAAGAVILAGRNGGFCFRATGIAVLAFARLITQGGIAFLVPLLAPALFGGEEVAEILHAKLRFEKCLLLGFC